jgi:hypothetical protein
MSDPGSTYRTRDEISGVRQVSALEEFSNNVYPSSNVFVGVLTMFAFLQERDPIERIRKLILGKEIATVAELKVAPIMIVNLCYSPNCCVCFFIEIAFYISKLFALRTSTEHRKGG